MIDSKNRMELTRAERQVDYIGYSRNKNWSTFLKEPSSDRIRIRLLLFIRTVKKYFLRFQIQLQAWR